VTRTQRPLRIAHVTGESGFSGGEVQLFLLVEGLRKRGHRNLLVCPPGSRSEREALRRGIETRVVAMRSDASLPAAWRIGRELRRAPPDLVHLHTGRANWLGGLAAWRLGLPAVTTRRMDRPVKRDARTRFLYGSVVRRAVAISPAVARRLEAAGVPTGMTRVIYSAVDPKALHAQREREAIRSEEGLAFDTPCLLVLASLLRRKGIDVLIDAFAGIDVEGTQPVLWIAGEGPERAALVRRVRDAALGDRVRFLGPRRDTADLLEACDVFVLPSRQEGLGVAALEAMACARPVVASRVGGLGETVVHERSGLLVAPDDPAALCGALTRLLGDRELRERLGAAGPARVREGFLAGQMVEAYEALYREILDEVEPT
jgi:glycosyltransferase involved in cell wall biosynthesis